MNGNPTRRVGPPPKQESPGADAIASQELRELTAHLGDRFAASGPPAAGSAAAVTGATAAGLLEWGARLSEQRGPEGFRRRAHTIARRATALRSALAAAAQEDATLVKNLLAARRPGAPPDARRRATDSVLAIAARCALVANLAAEVAEDGRAAIRPDVVAALRLASCAAHCAVDLAEENSRSERAGEDWVRSAKRRAWRVRLLLQRASPPLQAEDRP